MTVIDPNQQATDGSTPPTAPGAQSFDPNKFVPIEQFNEMQSRYNGVNGRLQKEINEHNALKTRVQELEGNKAAELGELQNQLKTLNDAKTAWEQKEVQLTQAQQEALNNATAANRKAETAALIMSDDYQILAPFYRDGLLPGIENLEGDARKQFLDGWKTKLTELGVQKTQRQMAGSTPPAPAMGTGGGETLEQLQDYLMRSNPTTDEYRTKKAAYDALVLQQK